MKTWLLILFSLFGTCLYAQTDLYEQMKFRYDTFRKADQHDSALIVAQEMNRWALDNEGDTSLRYAVSFEFIGNCYYELLKYDSALFYYLSVLKLLDIQNRINMPQYYKNTKNVGVVYYYQEKYLESKEYFNRAIKLKEAIKDTFDLEYGKMLTSLGMTEYQLGNYDESELLLMNSLEIKRRQVGELNLEYIKSLKALALIYTKRNDSLNMQKCYQDILSLKIKIYPENEIMYVQDVFNIAVMNHRMENYITAEKYYKESLEIREKTNDTNKIEYVRNLLALAGLYSDIDYYILSENYYMIVKNKIIANYDYETEEYHNLLFGLSILYTKMGDYIESEQYNIKELYLSKKLFGENSLEFANSYLSLGVLYTKMAKYKQAYENYIKALNIFKQNKKTSEMSIVETLSGLSAVSYYLGDNNTALKYIKQSWEIISNSKIYTTEFADQLSSMGLLCQNTGNYTIADSLFSFSSNIKRDIYGDKSYHYAKSLEYQACLRAETGDYSSSNKIYSEAQKIHLDIHDKNNEGYYRTLSGLSSNYMKIGQYEMAKDYMLQSMEYNKKTKGIRHPDYIRELVDLGILYAKKNKYDSAEYYLTEAFKSKVKNINYNFCWLSEMEKKMYWGRQAGFYNYLTYFTAIARDYRPNISILAYNANLFSKSLLMDDYINIEKEIYCTDDSILKSQYYELKRLRNIIVKNETDGSIDSELYENRKNIADSINKIIINRLGSYDKAKQKFESTWKDVQQGLSDYEAAIEFSSYYDERDSVIKYIALLVRLGYEYPEIRLLGDEESIKYAINQKDFAKLYELVWSPFESLLEGVRIIYYSPAGLLNNVSFPALCNCLKGATIMFSNNINRNVKNIDTEDGVFNIICNDYLIDHYELHQLTTTRYISDSSLSGKSLISNSILFLGGIDYDSIPSEDISLKKSESNYDLALKIALEGEIESTYTRDGSSLLKMTYLEGTYTEVSDAADLLKKEGWYVESHTGNQAGESSFKNSFIQKKPGIIHIATHGFSFPDQMQKAPNRLESFSSTTAYKSSEDPMVRCGLMFSGSNISWTGHPEKMIEQTSEDGILTAAEVAIMDLSNTKLVVLSACETGLGKIDGSEGTFGLKRGFKLAGVEQIIVSLWSVPDKETMELMTLFYTDLAKTLNPVESFAKAQKEMRYRYPTEPEKWAGFVLVR